MLSPSTTLRNNPKLLQGSAARSPDLRIQGGQGLEALKPCQLFTDPNSEVGLRAVPSTSISLWTGGAPLEKTDTAENVTDTRYTLFTQATTTSGCLQWLVVTCFKCCHLALSRLLKLSTAELGMSSGQVPRLPTSQLQQQGKNRAKKKL